MSDYIKREDAMRAITKADCDDVVAKMAVGSVPAADVVEVKHGKWDRNPIAIVCSECGKAFGLVEMFAHYCPPCGAKMDLED